MIKFRQMPPFIKKLGISNENLHVAVDMIYNHIQGQSIENLSKYLIEIDKSIELMILGGYVPSSFRDNHIHNMKTIRKVVFDYMNTMYPPERKRDLRQ